jgi:hypothetical protein
MATQLLKMAIFTENERDNGHLATLFYENLT